MSDTEPSVPNPASIPASVLDLDQIERDLADVETALIRLDNGDYWSDEITGDPLPDDVLAEHPTSRRISDRPLSIT